MMIYENLRDEAAIINISQKLVGFPLFVLESLDTSQEALPKTLTY